jgi:outer membrane scaffolding protein for murein synthesis (MipA/OmpV family)
MSAHHRIVLTLAPRRLIFAAACTLWLVSGTASAADATDAATSATSAIVATPAAATPEPDWVVTLGAGVQAGPRYPGSNKISWQPIPAIDIEYKNRWFAKEDMPLGVYFINDARWSAGLALQYDLTDRRSTDSPRLAALGDLPMTPRAKLFAAYTVSALTVSSSLAQDIGGHGEGLVADVNAIATLPIGSQWYLSAGPGVTWGNRQYQDTYFGITPAQSAASGLPQYASHAGVNNAYLSLEADYLITKHWTATANVKLEQLQGSAARSPITESRQQTTSTMSLSYTF